MTGLLYDVIPLRVLWPELVLLIGGSAILIAGTFGDGADRRRHGLTSWIALVSLIIAIVLLRTVSAIPAAAGSGLLFGGLADYVRLSALILGVIITLVAWTPPTASERGEFFSMMLFSITGLMITGAADDLLVLFLALELTSIPTYIMVALSQRNQKAVEAATKYFYLGAFSAAIMAYGFCFLFGVSGTTLLSASIEAVQLALAAPGTLAHALATFGLVLGIGGVLFKVAAFPLHFYIADVYQGASSPVAGMLGFVPKLAGFAAIFKLITLTGWAVGMPALFWFLWVIAAISMTVGNVLALRQTSVKRMLAYSGIAHSGYMLVGTLAGPLAGQGLMGDGTAAVLYYMVVYGIANLGAFAILGVLHFRGQPCETVRDLAGLLRRYPSLALLMALAMFTLMGLPPTPGFWGKFALFGSAIAGAQAMTGDQQFWLLALVIIAVVNSAVAAAYYLRVIAAVLLYESDETADALPREAEQIGALLCGFLLLVFGFYPPVLSRTSLSATMEFQRIARVEHVAPAPSLDLADAKPPADAGTPPRVEMPIDPS